MHKTFLILLAAILATGAFGQTPEQEKEFLGKVEQACRNKDAKAFLELYCWNRVDKFMRDQVEELVNGDITNAIEKTALVPLGKDDVFGDYTVNGVTYALNLKPVKMLEVTYKGDGSGIGSFTVPVGLKDDKLMIAGTAPVSDHKPPVTATDGWENMQKFLVSTKQETFSPPALEMIARQYLKEKQITVDDGAPILNIHVSNENKVADIQFHKAENLMQVVEIGSEIKATRTYELIISARK